MALSGSGLPAPVSNAPCQVPGQRMLEDVSFVPGSCSSLSQVREGWRRASGWRSRVRSNHRGMPAVGEGGGGWGT